MYKTDQLRQTYLTTAIIAGSMVSAVFIYAGILRFLQLRGIAPVMELEPTMLEYVGYALLGLSGVTFLSIQFLRKMCLRKGTRPLSGGSSSSLPEPAEESSVLLGKLRMATVISCGLAETPAVCGLALGLLGGAPRDVYILFGISLVLLMFYFPRLERWKDFLRGSGWSSV